MESDILVVSFQATLWYFLPEKIQGLIVCKVFPVISHKTYPGIQKNDPRIPRDGMMLNWYLPNSSNAHRNVRKQEWYSTVFWTSYSHLHTSMFSELPRWIFMKNTSNPELKTREIRCQMIIYKAYKHKWIHESEEMSKTVMMGKLRKNKTKKIPHKKN